jgi:hypothetical protein
MVKKLKRKGISHIYVSIMNWECANPECNSGLDAEGHHIVPLYKGGVDKYWNLICLCFACHRRTKSHSKSEEREIIYFTWKSMQELRILGFYLDEQEEDFTQKYHKAIKQREGRIIYARA